MTAIRRVPNQRRVAKNQTRYHCSTCLKSFLAPTAGGKPARCPAGHREPVKEREAVPA